MRRVWLALLLALGGCTAHHYLVVRDQAPVYAGLQGKRVLTHLALYQHGPLPEAPPADAPRVRVPLPKGGVGYLARQDVKVFSYLDPIWDGGADRRARIGEELRALQLAKRGQDWEPGVVQAVRAGQIETGFTQEQVEVAWGWPLNVEQGPLAGGQSWVYHDPGHTHVDRWADDPWFGWSFGYGPYVPLYGYCPQSWHSPFYGWGPRRITVRVPVTIETRVIFDARGRVAQVTRQRLVEDD